MIKIQTFCDFCGSEFTSDYWDNAPVSIEMKLSNPAQAYESRRVDHACNGCRKAIVQAWDKLITKEKPDTP